ncbi:hypothetical protein BGW38_004421 [Lunasporangiospora selenospora]|uniref:S1/P1 Nuclease n=1 Tax=Lunasporangiospora selenospora TaxID=979761 RepID=A0A9P6KC66_9FUNG|nr:hypothetical protein BGW38_004421 [Lunasporangiospora selenospora]
MRLTLTLLSTASLFLLSASNVDAYGVVGHTLTGQIAQQFLTPKTAKAVKEILPEADEGLLSKATPWADKIKSFAQYKWANTQHYVNTEGDNPPDYCLFEYVYGGQDVVNGLFNMTATLKQLQVTPPTTSAQLSVRRDAIRFFAHFIGDIHQPLHNSIRDRGGNDAPIKWGRTKSNLHSMWDTLIITKDIKDNFSNDPQAYLDDVLAKAKSYWSDAATWTDCDPAQNKGENPWFNTTKTVKTLCPLQWATTMNALDCSHVWTSYSPTLDYSGEYFERMTSAETEYLTRKLLAMSGVRMAAVLNEIYDSGASSPQPVKRDSVKLPPKYLELLKRALNQ